ncbi:MAG TPA: winged helix DNA-binding domain-containing protein [Gemmatimonadales bacterium]|nr:winged helix DNA-binding domain-containing protein [Gemmatimonadales bacterium]
MNTIAPERWAHQFLSRPTLRSATDVVRTLGAVQSQDYGSAKWALAQRTPGLRDADVERAFARGAILRTHVLRPTWHFVSPKDARWMLELTAPRIRASQAYHERLHGLAPSVLRKSNRVLERALQDGRQRTRSELEVLLRRAGVRAPTGQHVGQLLMRAELDRVIISGPRRGNQFTYALFDERVPASPPRDSDAALVDLIQRYFRTRGPATLQDFAWWSGLTVADATRGAAAAGTALQRFTAEGRTYWHDPSRQSRRAPRVAHLLPNFDEYVVGFRDRSAIAERLLKAHPRQKVDGLIGHVVVVDGQIVGGWRRTLGEVVEIELRLRVPLTAREHELIQRAAQRFGRFLETPVRIRRRA